MSREYDLALAPISDTQLELSWSAIAGAHSYDIERNGVVIATHPVSPYTDMGFTPGSHSYRVRANLVVV